MKSPTGNVIVAAANERTKNVRDALCVFTEDMIFKAGFIHGAQWAIE